MNEKEKKMNEKEKEVCVVNPPEEKKEAKLTDNQILDVINNPVIYNMKPGFFQLGNELLSEVKEMLDYTGLARKVFPARQTEPGEVCRYDKEEDSVAYVVSEACEVIKDSDITYENRRRPKEIDKVEKGRYVYPLEFEVAAYPSIKKGAHRDVAMAKEEIKEVQEKAFQSIMYQEDSAAVKLLLEASKENQKIKSNPYDILDSLIDEFDSKRLICDKILLNRKDVSFFVKEFVNKPNKFKNKYIKPVEQLDLVRAGYVAVYGSTMLLTTANGVEEDIIPEGNPIALASPECLGGMPIRVELFSEPVNAILDSYPRYGWFWYELISMLVINTNAVILGGINY